MNFLIIIPIIIFVIAIIVLQHSRYNRLIHEKVEELGGTYLDHQRRWGFISIGPYKVVGKGQTVYCFTYLLDDIEKEGWVKFGSLFGPDWRV